MSFLRSATIAVTATALLSLVEPSAPADAAGPSLVANGGFTRSTVGWVAGSGDVLTRVAHRDGRTSGQVRPRRAKGRQTVALLSRASRVRTGPAGAIVRATARVRVSQPGRPVTFVLREVSGGRVVQRTLSRRVPRSTRWATMTATLRTVRADSRVRVGASVDVRRRHYLRLRTVRAVIARPGLTCREQARRAPDVGRTTFADEFSGSTLDRSRWRARDDTYLDFDAAVISRDNVSVHDGMLDLMGRRLPADRWRTVSAARHGEANRVRRYSTAYLDTIADGGTRGFAQRYGHFEMRARVPTRDQMSRGLWPAFWLRANGRAGEVDVMEAYGAPTSRALDLSSTYQWSAWADTTRRTSHARAHGTADVGTDRIWAGWHRYAVTWSPSCLVFRYDGRVVGVADGRAAPFLAGRGFDAPFHLRLNLQVGSAYWGWPDPAHTRDEFHYLVDYVRVWALR